MKWCAAMIAVVAAVLLFAPLRTGDLTGYDDALYAHIAKGMVASGDWLNETSNGCPVFEHPPLVPWLQASLFAVGGFDDGLARLPSALCGWGVVLLVYGLAKRLLGSEIAGVLAMFVMATSVYFIKYCGRAMTDVPCTFFFLCAVYAWVLAEDDARWLLAAGLATAAALMSRGLIGVALPVVFVVHALVARRRMPVGMVVGAALLAFAPLGLWYAHTVQGNAQLFASVQAGWLEREVYGGLQPEWRRYTGAFEYLWMLGKSYWPWLPLMVAGVVYVVRERDRRRGVLVLWAMVVFVLCAVTKSRVLRYMLPAYPAFAVLAALGLTRWVAERYVRVGLRVLLPVLSIGVMRLAAQPVVHWNAAEIRPVAAVVTAETAPGERFAFYDDAQLRFDETNQLLWYGSRNFTLVHDAAKLRELLRSGGRRMFVLDRAAYEREVAGKVDHAVVASSGHLVCFKLAHPGAPAPHVCEYL